MSEDIEKIKARIRERAKTDDRDFAVIQAMAIAKARREPYDRNVHGPFREGEKMRRNDAERQKDVPEPLAAVLKRFNSKGRPFQPKMPDGPDRPKARRVADL